MLRPLASLAVALAALSACMGCRPSPEAPPSWLAWTPVDSLNAALPDGVRLMAGVNDTIPLRAWYLRAAVAEPDIGVDVVVSDDTDRRETVASFVQDLSACAGVNGGYFRMGEDPATHVGLLEVDDALVAPATDRLGRDSVVFPTARAALGLDAQERPEIRWAVTRGGAVFRLEAPPANRPGHPADSTAFSALDPWEMVDALGAGPMILQDGEVRVTSDAEVFFGTSIPEVHPRTAAGVTEDGALILMVVDGRQPESRGVSLDELARLMREVGAVDALNLDGGGSSTLVVGGTLVNRPAGDTFQREVMSAIVLDC